MPKVLKYLGYLNVFVFQEIPNRLLLFIQSFKIKTKTIKQTTIIQNQMCCLISTYLYRVKLKWKNN